jgi:hypothetical protein
MKTWREYAAVLLLLTLCGSLIVNFLEPLEFTSDNPQINEKKANDESLSMLWGDAKDLNFISVFNDLRFTTLALAIILFISVFATTQILSSKKEENP